MTSPKPSLKDSINLKLTAAVALVTLAFAMPLRWLVFHATNDELYSHTILVPFVTLYLHWENIGRLQDSEKRPPLAILPIALGLVSLAIFFMGTWEISEKDGLENYLAYSMFAYVSFIVAACVAFTGKANLKVNLFPMCFLVMMVPFPVWLRDAITVFFQYTSAEVAYWMIEISGIPILRDGPLLFDMPTIDFEVAPECSGLRSSLVLLVAILVSAYLFLNNPKFRTIVVLLVIPFAIIRNASRILVIALQCYHIGPEMISSWFHRSGGNLMFVLTLVPMLGIVFLFHRIERRRKTELAAEES